MTTMDTLPKCTSLREVLRANLRAARLLAGLKQAQAARRLGVAMGAVSDWERGKFQPSMLKLELIADVYDVPVWLLLKPDGLKPPSALRARVEVA